MTEEQRQQSLAMEMLREEMRVAKAVLAERMQAYEESWNRFHRDAERMVTAKLSVTDIQARADKLEVGMRS